MILIIRSNISSAFDTVMISLSRVSTFYSKENGFNDDGLSTILYIPTPHSIFTLDTDVYIYNKHVYIRCYDVYNNMYRLQC